MGLFAPWHPPWLFSPARRGPSFQKRCTAWTYCNVPLYRRPIIGQLNRGEGRHDLCRCVFHGNKGELRQPYREGQEEQPGALGLVVNCIVLYNTIYSQRTIEHLRADGPR